jgi:hypothetical protein
MQEENPVIFGFRGGQRWQFRYKTLIGQFLSRMEKYNKVEIDDPDLGKKLSRSQLIELSKNFPEYHPDRRSIPEPEPLYEEPLLIVSESVEESDVVDLDSMTTKELKAYMDANDIKYPTNKSKEFYLELAKNGN